MTALLWALIALPAVVGTGLCLVGRRAEKAAPALSVLTAAAGLGLAAAVAVGRPHTLVPFLPVAGFGLAVDGLSAVVVPTVAAVTLLVLLFAAADVRESRARFHGLMLLFAAAVSVTATATTLPALLFAWEAMGATSFALIGFTWQDREKVGAGLTAFLTTRTADLGLYLAAGAALGGGSGLTLTDLPGAARPWRDVVAAGILVAALGKAAQLPFSFWLSRAMEGPSPVSALLHSAAMVAMGGYLLLREAPLLHATAWAGPTTAWVGALTTVALGAVAVAQSDLKQLLAASTSAQLGFVVLAAGASAVAGGTAQLVAHAATKALLFLAAGAWLSALGTKELSALQGAARRWPVVGWTAAVGLLSLAGVAPLSLWATKDEVLAGARESSAALYLVGLAGAVLSAAYSGKALWLLWRALPADAEAGYDTEERGTRRVSGWQSGPLVVLAVAAAVLGVLTVPPLSDSLRRALGAVAQPSPAPWELALSAGLAVMVVLAAGPWRWPEPRWAAGWLGLGTVTQRLVVHPVLALARTLARFDDGVLDRAVDATAAGTARLARTAAAVDDHGVDAAVEQLAACTRRLGALARRTQTGLLQQYYIQAAAVLGAAALLLLVAR
ncbi:MAG: proton-conducting transporter transmembrane domain-containing protein [Motilibacteraceae bacterium]